jgi:iron-sulfur cluster repair protein YtfE (RIC family)
MTDARAETIDFTMMYVTHDALRRDLGRLTSAAAAGTARSPAVRAGWENFKAQLHVHHTVEDDDLWPRLYRAVADRPDAVTLLQEMEAEHAVLDPLLAAVDEALAGRPNQPLASRLEGLAAALDAHLTHEEERALPLIQSVLTLEDWRGFAKAMARAQGVKGAAVYVPWIVDGATAAERKRFFAALPRPVRVINRLLWEPRYRRRSLWAVS